MERLYRIHVDETTREQPYIADEYEWGGRAGKEYVSTDNRFYGDTPNELAKKIIEQLPFGDIWTGLFEEDPYTGCRNLNYPEAVDFKVSMATASRGKTNA